MKSFASVDNSDMTTIRLWADIESVFMAMETGFVLDLLIPEVEPCNIYRDIFPPVGISPAFPLQPSINTSPCLSPSYPNKLS